MNAGGLLHFYPFAAARVKRHGIRDLCASTQKSIFPTSTLMETL